MSKPNTDKSVTDKTLARLRRQGVDISDLYEVIAALESEIDHYREVVQKMQDKLRTQPPRRTRGETYYDHILCSPFNLPAHIQDINESGHRIVSMTQDSQDYYTILIEAPCDG